jgi:hypothetical protein
MKDAMVMQRMQASTEQKHFKQKDANDQDKT